MYFLTFSLRTDLTTETHILYISGDITPDTSPSFESEFEKTRIGDLTLSGNVQKNVFASQKQEGISSDTLWYSLALQLPYNETSQIQTFIFETCRSMGGGSSSFLLCMRVKAKLPAWIAWFSTHTFWNK
jgi:hypothetical protein